MYPAPPAAKKAAMYSPQDWPGGATKRFSSAGVHCTRWPCSSVETRPEMRRVKLGELISYLWGKMGAVGYVEGNSGARGTETYGSSS